MMEAVRTGGSNQRSQHYRSEMLFEEDNIKTMIQGGVLYGEATEDQICEKFRG